MDVNTLIPLAENAKNRDITSLFSESKRAQKYSVSAAELFLDYSKQNINEQEFSSLISLAKSNNLSSQINSQFSGEIINNTEQRAVLHTLLRAPNQQKIAILKDQADEVIATEQKMADIVEKVSSGKITSSTGEKFTDVIAVGIGGSFYGVKIGLSALQPYLRTGLNVHVIANVDGGALAEKLARLTPATTLLVVISKTFTTQETLLNAKAIKAWLCQSLPKNCIEKQCYAVSSNVEKATEFGIAKNNILPMWDWVGGRFSLWSAVGLPLALAIGNDNFARLKQGAFNMDQHFQNAPFEQNMPVIMALLGIWNRNALGYPSLAILPYQHSLRALPGYLQQTDMESNGKSVSTGGEKLAWLTAPIVFGQEGTNGQHAFMQLMHQSDDIIPTDFIVSLNGDSEYTSHHQVLVANCFAQSEALMQGKTLAQAKQELQQAGLNDLQISQLAPHKTMKGNTPSNTLVCQKLSPESLGAMLALYEHKIFVQGALWQVNSYDQWGVELGKVLGKDILSAMQGNKISGLSSSTEFLLNKFQQGDI
ncbi:glucose-6-phosphate isomerase [Thalassotalea sp. PLHSN55]|uniref:glucose-6-phosphate isomerase n=1 Tax=Thalassotalea sp. PLHSN55 TaxID=3435888 RepID=UPI003F864B10